MKIYTRGGDDGSTGLYGGSRVAKDSLRVTAYGEVDELNSVIGWAIAACKHNEIRSILETLQPLLFEMGADLCTPPSVSRERQPVRITPEHAAEMESWIDQAWEPLPPLKHFVLPGGTELAGRLHLARTVCRRAERSVVALAREEGSVAPALIVALNRLSDLLFALARRANQLGGHRDIPWIPGESP